MADGSPIEWLQRPGTKPATWNPIRAHDKVTGKRGWFCVHVHEGCKFCYAETRNINRGESGGNGQAYKAQNIDKVDIILHEPTLLQPLKWRQPRTIFPCSMTDLFGEWVTDAMLDRIFAVAALCPQHTFICLTKRPDRMRAYLANLQRRNEIELAAEKIKPSVGTPFSPKWSFAWPLPNVWGLVSCSTQEDADKFVPQILNTPLAVRGVSYEPALGPIDFTHTCLLPQKPGSIRAGIHINALVGRYCESGVTYKGDWDITGPAPDATWPPLKLDWVIVGGESGGNARPMHPDWARSIVAQCEAAGVAKFFKQWGEWKPLDQFKGQVIEGAKGHGVIYSDGRFVNDTDIADPPRAVFTFKFGKKAAGRSLDGKEYSEFPEVRT